MASVLAGVLPAPATRQAYLGKVSGPSGPGSPPFLCHPRSHLRYSQAPRDCLAPEGSVPACQCGPSIQSSHCVTIRYVLMQRSSACLRVKKPGRFCGKWQSISHIPGTGVQEHGALSAGCRGALGNGYGGTRAWLLKRWWFCLRGAKDMWNRLPNVTAGNVVRVKGRS